LSQIPEARSAKFFERKWLVELAAAVPPVGLAGVTAAAALIDNRSDNDVLGYILSLIALWLVVVGVLRVVNAHTEDRKQAKELDYDGLKGALHTIHSSVAEYLGFSDEEKRSGRLRITIHRVVPSSKSNHDPEETEQLLPYIGGSGKDPGRRFSVRSGIVGKAVRKGAPFREVRESDDYEEFVHELVSVWSYTDTEARNLTPDRQAWVAVPIFESSRNVTAVVFLDSNERTLFDGDVYELIINGCIGVARYIEERYG